MNYPDDDDYDEVGGGDPPDGPELNEDFDPDVDNEPNEAAADAACDRYQRDIERNYP